MGSWGAGLYEDDTAADLRNTIRLLVKLPADGDRLLEILLEGHTDSVGLEDDGGPSFWLVVADQFERRGIASTRVFETALQAIDGGADLRDMEAREMEPADLRRRAKVLSELATRLRNPRPLRPRPKATKPPAFCADVGAVYAFPTMHQRARNPWNPALATHTMLEFEQDGWGAMLVVARGRVFDWLPWCAVASLTVPPSRRPELDDTVNARFLKKQGADYRVSRSSHMRRLEMDLLGTLRLDPEKAARAVSQEFTPQYAVLAGWSFYVMGWDGESTDVGVAVADLLA